MPLIPAIGRSRQTSVSKFEASLVWSSKTARVVILRNPVLKSQNIKITVKIYLLPCQNVVFLHVSEVVSFGQ